MKTKRLLSVIAVILALLITLNTASAAMGTAADYLNEITATENSNESENDIFSPPEKSPVSENEDITVSRCAKQSEFRRSRIRRADSN